MDDRTTAALSMCQTRLALEAGPGRPALDRETIANVVRIVLSDPFFSEVDEESLRRALEERFTVFVPGHDALGSDTDHVQWLPGQIENIKWRFWERYRDYLIPSFPHSVITSIDEITFDVLGRLENPGRTGKWDRRGLVMGHVQSGKTANYCGLICKAADAGYKVFIILSGIHNSLRSQTQIRMDEGFIGYMSQYVGFEGAFFPPTGAGKLDSSLRADTATNRAEKGDFNRSIAKQFGIHPGGNPLLFVVKKNVSVLKNLNNWIMSFTDVEEQESRRRYVKNVPLMVIDDEADLASVDTRKMTIDENGDVDPDHDPTKTNQQIRKLLRLFEKVAYVGYTATPFANIFIYENSFSPKYGEDLFPRSFILTIPAPSNYMGPQKVFGLPDDPDIGIEEADPLPLVRTVTDHAVSERNDEAAGWMPPKLIKKTRHEPLIDGERRLPGSLHEAIRVFILSSTIRKIRQCMPRHNSMLIHVVRFTDVQKRVANQVQEAITEITFRLRYGDGSRNPTIIDDFRRLYEEDFIPVNEQCREILGSESVDPLPDWEIVSPLLLPLASGIRLRTVNGSAGDILDYEENKEKGIDLIAIGGDKLSRGLTLEGLTVSYFLRASRMYDTLMQMGRWFGYRDHYIDLCRLYTTREIRQWFTHIALASEELQRELSYMVSTHSTPKDYGLMVRSHPSLMVTSQVKMRTGTKMPLSYSGSISETIIFDRDPKWIELNFDTTQAWLSELPNDCIEHGSGRLWRHVPAGMILEYLGDYRTHPDSLRADARLLANYIRTQQKKSELTNWSVKLCSIGDEARKRASFLGSSIGLVQRKALSIPSDRKYTIRRLVSPLDELADLTEQQTAEALKVTIENWLGKPEGRRPVSEPTRPGGMEIREVRDKTAGLLLVYPLIPQPEHYPDWCKPVIGIAISFPKSKTAKDVSYIVNNTFQQQDLDDDTF